MASLFIIFVTGKPGDMGKIRCVFVCGGGDVGREDVVDEKCVVNDGVKRWPSLGVRGKDELNEHSGVT